MIAPFSSSLLLRSLAAGVAAAALVSAQAPAFAKVGVAAAVNTDAKGRPPGAAPRVISLGQNVIFNEEITTDGRGLVQILLLDGTTFTVGPNSQLTIDEFVYNPATGDAKVVATVAKGAFRFIGGQTSRRPDGATINTPVGTIGIRGAMVEGRVESSDKALFSMIFGDEVQFRGRDGRRSRIYEPGYTLVVQGGGGGGLDTNVRRRTEGDATTFQSDLSGNDGQTGGADDQPDDGTVDDSPIGQSNSNLPNNAPLPTPRSVAVKATDVEEVETNVGDIDTRGEIITPPTTSGTVYYGGPGAVSGFSFRSLGAPQIFTQEEVTLTRTGGRLVSDEAAIDLPDYTGTQGDAGLETFTVDDGFFGVDPLTGYAYAGRGDFAAYLLEYGTETVYPFYMIHGTGTELTEAPENVSLNDIRQYTLTVDPSSGGAPFFAPTSYGPVTNPSSTNFYIVEPADSTTGEFETFMSWISIEGEGLNQKSAAFVTASAASEDEAGTDILDGTRRGSYRSSSYDGAVNMRGYMTTLAGPDGSHFFGDNADHFVIGSSLDPNDSFVDSSVDPYDEDGVFVAHHVAALVEETPQEEVARTTRTVSGFMAGVAESDLGSAYALAGEAGPNFFMQINAENHSVAAVGIASDVNDGDYFGVDKYLLTFGAAPEGVDGVPLGGFSPLVTTGEGATGGSTFVNDDVYGAVQNNSPENTRILTDGYLGEGESFVPGVEIDHTDETNAGSYLVSGRAVPIAGYSHCADCDFADWGWWGTRVRVTDPEEEGFGTRTDYVHMGTWVAGDITAEIDMPVNVRATYEGTLLGTVVEYQGEGQPAQYIATGTFGMSYNFNDRAGAFWIDDFAGVSVSGNAYGAEGGDQALFYAEGSGEYYDPYFYVSGAFVNDGDNIAGGVIGDFTIGDPNDNFYGVGTIVGKQTERVEIVTARVLTAPDIFVPLGTEPPVDNAGERGLVGTTETSDRTVVFDKIGGSLLSESEVAALPDVTGTQGDTGLEAIAVSGYALEQDVSGTAYAGAGDFAAYLLGFDGDPTDPYYLIAGTPTSQAVISSLNTGTNVREYTLTQDPIQGIDAPFFFDDRFGPIAPESLSSTNLYIVESNTAANYGVEDVNYDAKVFQSWVSIEGDGVAQKSAAQIYVTSIGIDSDGNAELAGGRRGSFRYNAYSGPANTRGSIAAIEGASGNAFFGENANNFVLGADVDTADSYNDSLLGPGFSGDPSEGYIGTGYPFSTHHVADLVDTTPQAELGRTSRTVSGYMSGLVESNIEGIDYPFAVWTGTEPLFTLTLNAETNDVSASATLVDKVVAPDIYGYSLEEVFNPNESIAGYELGFGPIGESGGASAFVDDNLFAASRNGDNENTRVNFENEDSVANNTGDNPGSYLVSGRANPIEGYAHCTQCSFLDWGWWGTRTVVEDPNEEGTRRDFVHMGTWVAGDVTSNVDMPTDISATYEGTALANIARSDGEGGVAKYIAAGTMDMSFDFNSRLGEVNIDIDGLELFSEVNGNVIGLGQSHFAGGMGAVDTNISGGLSGAFVNNGNIKAGGVIGNFTFEGENRLGTGTIAGIQTGTSPSLPSQ